MNQKQDIKFYRPSCSVHKCRNWRKNKEGGEQLWQGSLSRKPWALLHSISVKPRVICSAFLKLLHLCAFLVPKTHTTNTQCLNQEAVQTPEKNKRLHFYAFQRCKLYGQEDQETLFLRWNQTWKRMVRRERGAVQVLLKAPAIPPAKSWEADSMWDLWSCVRRWEEALLPTTLWPELTLTLASVRITIFAASKFLNLTAGEDCIQYPLEQTQKDSNFDEEEEEESIKDVCVFRMKWCFALVFCNLFFLCASFLQFLFLFGSFSQLIRLFPTPHLHGNIKTTAFWCNERFAATWSLSSFFNCFFDLFTFLSFVGIWLLCNDLQLFSYIHSIWKPGRWYEFENVVRRYLLSPLLLSLARVFWLIENMYEDLFFFFFPF